MNKHCIDLNFLFWGEYEYANVVSTSAVCTPRDHSKPIEKLRLICVDLAMDAMAKPIEKPKNRLALPKKRKLTDAERFPDLNESQIQQIRDSTKKANTEKSDKKCEKIFVSWLSRHKYSACYWEYSVQELNEKLGKFWFEARTQTGEQYTTASLSHIRYGINRCLAKKGVDYDIVDGQNFKDSTNRFTDACKQLKAVGKGYRTSYKPISPKGNNNYFYKHKLR